MPALPHQRRDREMQRRLAAGGADGADAALERRDALLEHGDGGVRDPRIDVAGALEIEQRGGMIDVAEDVGRRLVDRHRARAEDRVRMLARMQAERVEFQEFGVGHRKSDRAGEIRANSSAKILAAQRRTYVRIERP